MLGPQGVVRLSPDEAVTIGLGVTEGIEDAIAVMLSAWQPVWAATSAGGISKLPVLAGVQALTLFADADTAGLQAAERAAIAGAQRGARSLSPLRGGLRYDRSQGLE